MEKINKSRLMKRAWYLVKEKYYSLSFALTTVWAEMKEAIKRKINESAPVQEMQTSWTPNPQSMQDYYNSNSYKGD